ncbi:hypothetical protein [Paraburkholderia sp. PGU19]|uniref:hypothetical protein n=1 Tax=Paraburkholderia sp. PGU19 TaxID=2735434 RepID=UPI0015DA459D|nr:hypothetical protein [Paraburkholderia sp. PGU19]
MLEEKQNRTCLGCNQLERCRWSGTTKYVCSIGMQKASTDVYEMPRCKKYSDGESMTLDQSEQIEELLLTWYRWQIRQSHAETLSHFYRPEDRTCRGYVTPSNLDEDDEAAYQWADDRQSEQVQLCVDMLPAEQRAAISTSMRNKESGRTVWSSGRAGDQHSTYQAAKERLLSMFVSRHLIRDRLEV